MYLDFLFRIIFSFDLSFYFFIFCNLHKPFCKRHYPFMVFTKTMYVPYTGTCTLLYILLSFIYIIKA